MEQQPIVGVSRIFMRPANAAPGTPFVDLGECSSAIAITLSSGQRLYSGKPEAIFSLRLDEKDKEMLSGMKIGGK